MRDSFSPVTWWAVAVIAGSLNSGCAAPTAEREEPPAFAVAALAAEAGLTTAHVGVIVIELGSGRRVAELNAEKLFIPASTMKVALSFAALKGLGPDYRFTTSLWAAVREGEGHTASRLVLVGSGDPFLVDGEWEVEVPDAWKALAAGLKDHGIDHLAGPLIIDASLFGRELIPPFWSWGDLDVFYAAPVSSVNVGHNVIIVETRPGSRVGGAARVRVLPDLGRYSAVQGDVVTESGSHHRVGARRDRSESKIRVSGSIGTATGRFRLPVTIANPPEFAGHWLAASLRRTGVAVDGDVRVSFEKVNLSGHVKVGEVHSDRLESILSRMNRESDNLAAEAVLRALTATRYGGGDGDWTVGLRKTFQDAGLCDPPHPRWVDGSGLSRTNLLAPVHLGWILEKAAGDAELDLRAVLPSPRDSRHLRSHPLARAHEERVVAKTGSFETTHCLAGYYLNERGDPELAFVSMVNGLSSGYQPALEFERRLVEEIARLQARP